MTMLAPPAPPSPANVRIGRGWTKLDDLLASLGNVPASRVIFDPLPGTVTPEYYEKIDGRVDGFLVELVNNTLVEKAMGHDESRIGANFLAIVWSFVRAAKLGFVTMADDLVKMTGGNRRQPDVTVYLKADYPNGVRPTEKVASLPPRLAVEVLSEDNTVAEIAMKMDEYFASGCRLAYVIDPKTRTARRYTAADASTDIAVGGTLDGGDVLPGFEVTLAELFDDE